MNNEIQTVLGVIGGSGVYQMNGGKVIGEHKISTPFGDPSDVITELEISERRVFFLSRHGRGHKFIPSEVPFRANIHALKQLGVTNVLAVSAVGIMQEHINPGDLVIPDQIYDRTKGIRDGSYFGNGCAGHVTFADPFCGAFSNTVSEAAKVCGATVHTGGTYVCIEGPQFSTRAESKSYREALSPVVVGMTAIPEAKLAREAELCYSMLALATDYDCWHETEADVSVSAVLAVLRANSTIANRVICKTAELAAKASACQCHSAAEHAIMTDPSIIPRQTKERLQTLYGKYWN